MSFKRIRRDVGLSCEDPSLTEQCHARSCDVTSMFNRMVGGDTSVCRTGGAYVDLSEMPDNLQAVLNKQLDGRRAFERLPQNVRDRYPTAEEFYRAVNDPNSRKTFEELGLLKTPEVVSPVKVEVINESINKENKE